MSELSLGTVELGLEYGIAAAGVRLKPDESHAAKVLHEAIDLGINLLDTARAYGDAEEVIGRALLGRRKDVVIVSKIAASPQDPSRVCRSVQESLAALQTDYVDVMMIHCGVDALPDEETAGELVRLRDSGAIRFVGASVYGERAALAAIDSGWCDCMEIAYSILDRRPEKRILARAAEENVGILARSVLLKGALTRRLYTLPADFTPLRLAVERLLEVTQATIEMLPELAYRYVLMQEPLNSALVGSAEIAELRACAAYAEKGALPAGMVERIQDLEGPDERWLNPGLWPST